MERPKMKQLKTVSIKCHQVRRIVMKLPDISLVLLASTLVVGAVPNAQAEQCSNASLKGSYGFYSTGTVVPAGTPRVVLGRETYDGKGNFTNTVMVNSNGTVTQLNDFGTYTVNADCTGTLFGKASGVTLHFVLVDGGKEVYRLILQPPQGLVVFGISKKQFPDNEQD
jgi:hypothetical protein